MPRQRTQQLVSRQCPCGAEFFPKIRSIQIGLGLYCCRGCSNKYSQRRQKPPMTLACRFWRHANQEGLVPDDASLGRCWDWTGSKAGSGKWAYGKLGASNSSEWKAVYAHRVSYELHVGEIPDGSVVRHRCDRPICVNPSHLLLGTCADNTIDMHEKGRSRTPRFTRTKAIDARRRRLAGESINSLAKAFGVTRQSMSRLLSGKTWIGVC